MRHLIDPLDLTQQEITQLLDLADRICADPAVVDLGVRFLRTISLFYLMPAATNGIQGFLRPLLPDKMHRP